MGKHLAVLAALLVLGAGCGRDDHPPAELVYKVVVRVESVPPAERARLRLLQQGRHVEWVEPASRRWRIESRFPVEPGSTELDESTHVFTGSACVDLVDHGPSLRSGSRRFLGSCADASVALGPILRYVRAGREPPERLRTESAGFEFVLAVEEELTPSEADEQGLFDIPNERFSTIARELEPGEEPAVPIRGYWLGKSLGERDAFTAIERRTGGEILYTVFYRRQSARGESHAYPGASPGEYARGEIQVMSRPHGDSTAQDDLPRLRRQRGSRITLANGERATLFPGFTVLTGTTIIYVRGPIPKKQIRAIAEQLRPL